MKKFFLIILFFACVDQKSEIQLLEKHEFQVLMNQDVQLIDVRTSEEYSKGFIEEAQNIDYNSTDFASKISKLDKISLFFFIVHWEVEVLKLQKYLNL
jgi:rhodanese-related sulfurtransferase